MREKKRRGPEETRRRDLCLADPAGLNRASAAGLAEGLAVGKEQEAQADLGEDV